MTISPSYWGSGLWKTMYAIAFDYPEVPTELQKKAVISFFESLKVLLPCDECRKHYNEFMEKVPIKCESSEQLKRFINDLQNDVLKRDGDKVLLISEIENEIKKFIKVPEPEVVKFIPVPEVKQEPVPEVIESKVVPLPIPEVKQVIPEVIKSVQVQQVKKASQPRPNFNINQRPKPISRLATPPVNPQRTIPSQNITPVSHPEVRELKPVHSSNVAEVPPPVIKRPEPLKQMLPPNLIPLSSYIQSKPRISPQPAKPKAVVPQPKKKGCGCGR